MQPPAVRLIVLNYNGGDLVRRCVEHLEGLDWPRDQLDLVVVDNDSSDGSDRDIEQQFPKVRLIRSGGNLGFPANNLGMRDRGEFEYVGLVNNDAFVEPGWLRAMVDAFDADASLGAVCPKILLAARFIDLGVSSPTWRPSGDPRDLGVRVSGLQVDGVDGYERADFGEGCFAPERGGSEEPHFRWLGAKASVRVPVSDTRPATISVRLAAAEPTAASLTAGADPVEVTVTTSPTWFECPVAQEPYDVINNVGSVLVEGGWGADRGFLERDEGQYSEPAEVFAWCGAGVLFRSRYLDDVGLFDERFFMYYEDTDLAWRGRARGWRYHYTPEAVMRHVHAATSVEGSPLFQHFVERNRLAMLVKNAPLRMALGAVWGFITATGSYSLRDIVRPLLRRQRPQHALVRARLGSFAAFARLLPWLIRERRRLRRGQVVDDRELVAWTVPR